MIMRINENKYGKVYIMILFIIFRLMTSKRKPYKDFVVPLTFKTFFNKSSSNTLSFVYIDLVYSTLRNSIDRIVHLYFDELSFFKENFITYLSYRFNFSL